MRSGRNIWASRVSLSIIVTGDEMAKYYRNNDDRVTTRSSLPFRSKERVAFKCLPLRRLKYSSLSIECIISFDF